MKQYLGGDLGDPENLRGDSFLSIGLFGVYDRDLDLDMTKDLPRGDLDADRDRRERELKQKTKDFLLHVSWGETYRDRFGENERRRPEGDIFGLEWDRERGRDMDLGLERDRERPCFFFCLTLSHSFFF